MISSKSIIINKQSFIYSSKIDIDVKVSDDYPSDFINQDYKKIEDLFDNQSLYNKIKSLF